MKNTSTVSFPFLFLKKWEQLHSGTGASGLRTHSADRTSHKPFEWPSFSRVSLTLLFSKRNNLTLKVQGVLKFTSDQSPIPGINIHVKGVDYSTTTDQYGKFSMLIPNPDSIHTLCASFESYTFYESEKLSCFMKEDFTFLGEKVIIGNTDAIKLSLLEDFYVKIKTLFTSAAEREIEKYFRSV